MGFLLYSPHGRAGSIRNLRQAHSRHLKHPDDHLLALRKPFEQPPDIKVRRIRGPADLLARLDLLVE